MTENKLGIVVSGSLTGGVEVRLDSSASVEEIVVGRYVTIEGEKRRFFGMITDISLGATNEQIIQNPPDNADSFITRVLAGTSTFGNLHILPMLTVGGAAEMLDGPQPVKTVPAHFSSVKLASDSDMALVFGEEDKQRFFIGNPLDMETRLCLNLEEFVKRSNGIFGKSGTGKTFITRILLAGMLQKSKAVNLVFDMHNEYGWSGTSEGGPAVKGLKQLFPSSVAVFTLDEQNSHRRGASIDAVVKISFAEIEPEDIALLKQTLNLTDQAVEAIYQLHRRFGRDWIQKTLSISDFDALPEGLQNIHESTFKNLQRGLATIERLPFMQAQASGNTVGDILAYLDKGINVVLEFGRHRDITTYVLVSNMLSRRIYNQYQARTEESMASGDENTKPRPLVITIEEAHKFLNPEVANQTIFGTIAREMRKYNVTLLVIDQRPSGIDEEVMSQLGTKITCLLDNERDIDAVLGGVSGKNELKSVLTRLAAKQQALIFGHAVPMPVAFKPREYGSPESYKELVSGASTGKKPSAKDIEDLWK